MILRDSYSTSYDLVSLFSWQTQYFRQVEWKNPTTRIVTRPSALHLTFRF